MEDIIIRPANEQLLTDYLKEILEIDKELFGIKSWSAANFLSPLREKFKISLLAFELNRVVGYSVVYQPHPNTLHISRLGVSKKHQKRNVGKRLIEEIVRLGVENSYSEITLELELEFQVDNFYLKLGFNELKSDELIHYLKQKEKLNKIEFYTGINSLRKVMRLSLIK